MDYFVDRDRERDAFQRALDCIYAKDCKPRLMLFHGPGGMGKTFLIKRCQAVAEGDKRKPFCVYVDCHRTDMTLEVLFNDIHTELEDKFPDYFKKYIAKLEEIDDVEKEIDEEAISTPENAQQLAKAISSVASKAIVTAVPGAAGLLGESQINDTVGAVAGLALDGITAIRRKFAKKKLDKQKYRLFLKDLQSVQARELASLLNQLAEKEKKKIILFVDRFEKLVLTPNVKSDFTYYEYWRDSFLSRLSKDILVVHASRNNFYDDLMLHLPGHEIESHELQPFKKHDIKEIIDQMVTIKQQMLGFEEFIKLVFEKTEGYPVAIGVLRGQLMALESHHDIERVRREVLEKETDILDQSIKWFLDNSVDESYRDTIYKLAICCSQTGQINKDAIQYICRNSNMTFPQVELYLKKLSQQYSFIDCIQWTMHELARKMILRYLKLRDADYLIKVNRDMQNFYADMVEAN